MKVIHPSTAANYFHALRIHMRLPYRKPMIVIAPKKLLKFKGASSTIEEFGPETSFKPIYPDSNPNAVADSKIKKVIVCAG
jgi:2-oxoglutarate dehydrogenase E1 component